MPEREKFEFERSRGIVWVCDLANSSHYLNDNTSASDLEEFLPRFFWVASGLVEAAGGRFVKWTGDGFIAWFDVELHRTLGQRTSAVFNAAWQITFFVNVTKLGLPTKQTFKLRHGIVFEQDALLIHITHSGGYGSLDFIGRGVVLASRLAGIQGHFPNIVTQGELVKAVSGAQNTGYSMESFEFCRWQPSPDDRLKYFKSERWGTQSIYISCERKKRPKGYSAVVKQAKQALDYANEKRQSDEVVAFANRFVDYMQHGPDWCKDIIKEELRFIEEELAGSLRRLLEIAPTMQKSIEERQKQASMPNEQQEHHQSEPTKET